MRAEAEAAEVEAAEVKAAEAEAAEVEAAGAAEVTQRKQLVRWRQLQQRQWRMLRIE